ncbi:MAG: hypothetical protein AAF587_44570, partial [Bacteroidota bacterium]
DPQHVRFPGMTSTELEDIEATNRTVSSASTTTILPCGDGNYNCTTEIDEIVLCIISSSRITSHISDGPLSEDKLMPPKTFISSDRHSNTTPEDLSEASGISIDQAEMTLLATTQHHAWSAIMPLSRRYRMDRMFEPKRLASHMASDTMDLRTKGIHGFRQSQVFGNKQMFCEAYPMKDKTGNSCSDALKKFIRDYGAPISMITDGSREQTARGSAFNATLRKNKIEPVVTQPHRPQQNPVETVIRELRKRWYRAIFQTNCP